MERNRSPEVNQKEANQVAKGNANVFQIQILQFDARKDESEEKKSQN